MYEISFYIGYGPEGPYAQRAGYDVMIEVGSSISTELQLMNLSISVTRYLMHLIETTDDFL